MILLFRFVCTAGAATISATATPPATGDWNTGDCPSAKWPPPSPGTLSRFVIACTRYTSGSSPPSPVFERAPMEFIAAVMVWCASGLSEPRLIALATNRLHRLSGTSTSATPNSGPAGRISSRSRSVTASPASRFRLKILNAAAGSSLAAPALVLPTTVCRAFTLAGCHLCGSADSELRKRMSPKSGNSALSPCHASRSLRSSSANPIPDSGAGVFGKHRSTTLACSPRMSNRCAPR